MSAAALPAAAGGWLWLVPSPPHPPLKKYEKNEEDKKASAVAASHQRHQKDGARDAMRSAVLVGSRRRPHKVPVVDDERPT